MKLNAIEKFGMNSFIHSIELKRVARRALQFGGEVEGGRVLEIGCGGGLGVEFIFAMFRPSYVEAFEFDPDQLRIAEHRLVDKYDSRIKLYEASATAIPASDNQFDAVFDFGVLHHIPDNQTALDEIARVLKPEGRFFFQARAFHFVHYESADPISHSSSTGGAVHVGTIAAAHGTIGPRCPKHFVCDNFIESGRCCMEEYFITVERSVGDDSRISDFSPKRLNRWTLRRSRWKRI